MACHLTLSDMQVYKLAQAEADRLLRSCAVGIGENTLTLSTGEMRSLMQEIFVKFSAVDSVPDYETITIPRFRVAVSQSVCEGLVTRYQALHSKFLEEGGLASEVKGPAQIATLLGA